MRIQRTWASRAGISLVDLLVMMGMTLFLAILLLPAVHYVRIENNRRQCSDNQRKLAFATLQYNAKHSRLPGWAEPIVPWEQAAAPVPIGWVFPLLPHLNLEYLHRQATTAARWNAPPRKWSDSERLDLDFLVCPVDREARRKPNGLSYVANSGYRDRAAETLGPYAGGDPSYDGPEQDGPASAVFLNRYRTAGSKNAPGQSLDWISEHDGAADTLMFSENIHAGGWNLRSESTPDAPPREGLVTFNFANRLDSGPNNQLRINAAPTAKLASHEGQFPGANSLHPGGVVAAFCDGHAVFISQEIDWRVWTLLFTPHGAGLQTTWPDGVGEKNVFAGAVLSERF